MTDVSPFELALLEANSAPTVRSLDRQLDRLPISADAKALMSDIVRFSVEIGGAVVKLGRKIIAIALDLLKLFPLTSFGLIVAVVATALVAAIPLLGPWLAAFIGPILKVFALTVGAVHDALASDFGARASSMIGGLKGLASA